MQPGRWGLAHHQSWGLGWVTGLSASAPCGLEEPSRPGSGNLQVDDGGGDCDVARPGGTTWTRTGVYVRGPPF